MTKIIIGVMGPSEKASAIDCQNAYRLGELIAQQGWVLLTGGRNVGVMEAASQGAKKQGGLTVGILPDNNLQNLSESVDIAIVTDMGNARNNINVLSSAVVIACGIGAGTISEIALAIKNGKSIIILNQDQDSQEFLKSLAPTQILVVNNPESAIDLVKKLLETAN